MTAHGANDATTDEARIRDWWTLCPNANIGMGLAGLVVVDVDPRNGGDVDALPHKLPDTCYAQTGGGGLHYLYRARAGVRYPVKIAPGIDLKRGAGSFIVVEPSVHESGGKYVWLDETDPWKQQPAEAPEWLGQINGAKHAPRPSAPIPEGSRAKVESALAYVSPDLAYDEWIGIGMAVHAELGPDALDVWNYWSSKGSKYPGRKVIEGHWKSFGNGSGITGKTLFKMAIQSGWRPPAPPKAPVKIAVARTAGITAAELLDADMPELRGLFPPFFYEGLTLLASAPKTGKTTLMRQAAEAGALCVDLLGCKPDAPFRTCFISLEEGKRLFKRKLKAMKINPKAAAMIDLFFEWPPGMVGCERLREHLTATQGTRLVVVDSLSRFRPPTDKGATQFQADYDVVMALSDVAKEFAGVCIVVIHHTRKQRGIDAMDDISGTYGLSAAADAFLVMRKQGKGATLHAGGRMWDQDDADFELTRDGQRWHMQGVSDGLTSGERFTLKVIADAGGMGPTELSKVLDTTRQNAYQRLDALLAKGKVEKRGRDYVAI